MGVPNGRRFCDWLYFCRCFVSNQTATRRTKFITIKSTTGTTSTKITKMARDDAPAESASSRYRPPAAVMAHTNNTSIIVPRPKRGCQVARRTGSVGRGSRVRETDTLSGSPWSSAAESGLFSRHLSLLSDHLTSPLIFRCTRPGLCCGGPAEFLNYSEDAVDGNSR